MHLGGICFSGVPSDDHELALCPRNHGISSVRIRPMKEGTANRIASSRCQERRMCGSCWLGRAEPKKYRARCNSQYSRTNRHEALLLHLFPTVVVLSNGEADRLTLRPALSIDARCPRRPTTPRNLSSVLPWCIGPRIFTEKLLSCTTRRYSGSTLSFCR